MIRPTLGIDIAKLKFDVCLLNPQGKRRHKAFPNTAAGFSQLAMWLIKQGVTREEVHACLEATGTYGEALAYYLHEDGYTVSVVNPAAVKAFAGSRLSRTKTDKVDASVNRPLLSGAGASRVDAARTGSARTASTCAPPGSPH